MNRFAVALAVVSLAGCVTVPELVVLAGEEPALRSGSILFRGPDDNLYVVRPQTERAIRLTSDASVEDGSLVYTAYAWAGDQAVYVTQEQTDGGFRSSFYAGVPGRRPRVVYRDETVAPFFLYPTADGRRVGVLGGTVGGAGLRMTSVELSSGEQTTHGDGQPFYAAWSPSGNQILTHVGSPFAPNGSTLSLASVAPGTAGGSPLPLRPGAFQTPAYSPDGERIAVVLRSDIGNGIHVLDAEGSDLGRLAPIDGLATLGFAPAGVNIAYIDGLPADFGGLVGPLSIAGIRNRRVSEAATAFFWSPDSQKLLYFEPIVVRTGRGTALAYRVGLYRMSEDRSVVVATIVPTDAFTRQIAPFFDQYARAYTIWSPDSRLVALNTVSSEGRPLIHLLDTSSTGRNDVFRIQVAWSGASVDWSSWEMQSAGTGLVAAEGVRSRVLTFGVNPFFSPR